jgi:hypothetical protein
MAKIQRWENIAGETHVEIYVLGGAPYSTSSDQIIPVEFNVDLVDGEQYELTISFLSSGYYDPGVLHNAPEDCRPPTQDDERLMDKVELTDSYRKQIDLSPSVQEELFEHFEHTVQDVELESAEYEEY